MKLAPVLIAAGITLAALSAPVRPVVVVGHSMDPTLQNHQMLLASRDLSNLQRGDVVVVDTPEGTSVKRIAFLEGDQVPQYHWKGEWTTPRSFKMKRLFELKGAERRNVTIPAGCIYVVGDNGGRSIDSRDYGPVPASAVRLRLENLPDSRSPVPGFRIARTYAINHA